MTRLEEIVKKMERGDVPLEEALRLAVDFTLLCIQVTCRDENAPWYGVEFEKALRYLPELLER